MSRGDACGVERSDMLSASELPTGLPAAAAACALTRSASVTDLLTASSSSPATCNCRPPVHAAALQTPLEMQQHWPANSQEAQHLAKHNRACVSALRTWSMATSSRGRGSPGGGRPAGRTSASNSARSASIDWNTSWNRTANRAVPTASFSQRHQCTPLRPSLATTFIDRTTSCSRSGPLSAFKGFVLTAAPVQLCAGQSSSQCPSPVSTTA